MREALAGLITGLIFGLGLCLSGVTDPAMILGFLDFAGDWNPTLIFVMVAGVVVTFLGYQFLIPKTRPLWSSSFSIARASPIDGPLVSGAVIFGVGWGLAGYCPGPAISSLAGGRSGVMIFVLSMLVGMIFVRWMRARGWANLGRQPAE